MESRSAGVRRKASVPPRCSVIWLRIVVRHSATALASCTDCFRELLENTWTPKKKHNGKAWTGPPQFEDPTGELMMLITDLAMVRDPAFRKYSEIYAKDEDKFFTDFAKAFQKLNELGVKCPAKKGWLSWLGL